MKPIIMAVVATLIVTFILFVAFPTYMLKREQQQKNPFTKLGSLATPNGMLAEVFEFRECYVIVQSVPSERAHAMVQMVCP